MKTIEEIKKELPVYNNSCYRGNIDEMNSLWMFLVHSNKFWLYVSENYPNGIVAFGNDFYNDEMALKLYNRMYFNDNFIENL